MKKKFRILCFVLAVAALFQACDYIIDANPPRKATCKPETVFKKILVEDYTGHKCGNCPAAARELARLDSIYPGKVIPMAVHAGYYAGVTPGSNPPYPTDFN